MRRILPAAIVCCILLLFLTATALDTTIEGQINTSFKGAEDALSAMKVLLGNVLDRFPFEKFASFFGVFGALISIGLTFTDKDSPEMTYMKEQFAKVNQKLDLIASGIDDMETLIKLETQRSQYIAAAHEVSHGFTRLNEFLDEILLVSCLNENDCLQKRHAIAYRFKDSLNIKQSLYMIFDGTYKRNVFGEPLFHLIKQHTKGDIGKLNRFADGILGLGLKGQQVILAYEKLTGSNVSIMSTMKDWLENMYKVRSEKDKYEEGIYKSIEQYIDNDVKSEKYQVQMSSNEEAANTMRTDLVNKYAWLDWITISCKHNEANVYDTRDGSFVNMPTDENKRKRVIIAVAQGTGSYDYQRDEFERQIRIIRDDTIFSLPFAENLQEQLAKRDVWRMTRALMILENDEDIDLNVARDDAHSSRYYHEMISFRPMHRAVHIIAIFKSKEEIDYESCTKNCSNGNGECRSKPYSATMYCTCKPYFQGSNCESKIKKDVAENMNDLFYTFFKIPNMVDVFYEVKNLGDNLGTSLGNIENAFASIDKALQDSFDNINIHFKWTNLVTTYSESLRKLNFTIKKFNDLPEGYAERRQLAQDTLKSHNIEFWISDLNSLIVGRTDILHQHKPIVLMAMDKFNDIGCSEPYKKLILDVWKKINILQLQGYMTWLQALAILDRPTNAVNQSFNEIVELQNRKMESETCQISIPNSENGNCSGQFALHRGMAIDLKCNANHYLNGTSTPSCGDISQCLPCNCSVEGSMSQQCDSNGACTCKPSFYGLKCGNRNCALSSWNSWSSCYQSCGYGGSRYQRRHVRLPHRGEGTICSDPIEKRERCFNGCCYSEFHCSRRKRCIPGNYKCNYRDDCGDNEDEDDCREKCRDYSTEYRDKHYEFSVNCDSGEAMKGFELMKRSDGKIRYKYRCCDINPNGLKLWNFKISSNINSVLRGHEYPDVHCPGTESLVKGFYYEYYDRGWWKSKGMRFWVYCWIIGTSVDYYSDTRWIYSRDMKSERYIMCRDRYFLNSFYFDKVNGRPRYRYYCTKIIS